MNKLEITKKVTEIVARASGISALEITPKRDFILDLCLDSLAIIEIVVDLERTFKTEISDELTERMHNINDVVEYIENNLQN